MRVRLLLADGSPAAGADVQVVEDLGGQSVLFTGAAGPAGEVFVPRAPRPATLIVRHSEAGATLKDWPVGAGLPDEVHWRLHPAAERSLVLRVLGPSGEQPLPRAEVALWLDGRRVWGRALAWLTGSHPAADTRGYWAGRGLPTGEVSVVAWASSLRGQAMRGDLDSLAQRVAYPWPDETAVIAVH